MGLTAKWHLVSVENARAYLKAIHTPDDHIAKLEALYAEAATNPSVYVEELTVDKAAGKAQRVVYIHGEKKRDSGLLEIGKEIERPTPDGRMVKAKATIDSDNKMTIHEVGPNFEATIVLELLGDELNVTLSSGSVVSHEKYKRA